MCIDIGDCRYIICTKEDNIISSYYNCTIPDGVMDTRFSYLNIIVDIVCLIIGFSLIFYYLHLLGYKLYNILINKSRYQLSSLEEQDPLDLENDE